MTIYENFKIVKLIFISFIMYLILIINSNIIIKNTNFIDILPSTNISNKNFPSLKEIFESKQLFINNKNITKEYIHFIKPINETEEKKYKKKLKKKKIIKQMKITFKYKKKKLNYLEYGQLCAEGKLIEMNKIILENNPLISVILPSFNKEKEIMKSIRSIQNQSLKNIEIIIVDDCSTDNSNKYYKYLLETDPRIRVFTHLENMGVWRSRLDGFLYSKGKYVIFFDTGDLYEDNFVLEDAYNIIEKYNLDSIKMLLRVLKKNSFEIYKLPIKLNKNFSKIIYRPNIEKYDKKIFGNYTNIWNRLTRKNIIIKGLYLLNSYILNIYKNLWEDIWWNKLINKVSYDFLIIERFSYLYFRDEKGEGSLKINTKTQKDKNIHEFIYFLYFNLQLLPKKNNKKIIIKRLKKYNESEKINLNNFYTKFHILNNLLELLIKDHFVSIKDKFFLYKLLKESKKRQKIKIISKY